jgi:short chain dehydrogenase
MAGPTDQNGDSYWPDRSGGSHILAYGHAPEEAEANSLIGTPDEIMGKLEALRRAGVEYVIMSFGGSRESLRRFAHEIMPAFSNEPVKVRTAPAWMAALDAVDGSCSEDEMAKVFIIGSSDGLGLMAGRLLAKQGHVVVLHARCEARLALPQAEAVLVGDLSTLAAMRDIADQANGRGRFDAVIHNVGIGYREPRRVETVDGLSQLWACSPRSCTSPTGWSISVQTCTPPFPRFRSRCDAALRPCAGGASHGWFGPSTHAT